jgi:adenosine deaminase
MEPSITLEEYRTDFIAPAKCADLAELLSYAPRSYPLMQTEEHLRLVMLDLFEQLRRDHVLYAEIRFAPLLHTERGLSAREDENPVDTHIAAFQYGRERGIPCTVHAGESRGADNVWETLQHLAPSRLGHGVRSIVDPALLEHLRQQQIHLEVCPSCNVQSNIYDTYADHPIDRLYRAGISVGVNTDDRTLVNITLSQEYAKLHETFGWDTDDFFHCNRNALKAAFVPDDVRNKLLARLADGYQHSF